MYIGIPIQIVDLFPEQPERADVDCGGIRQSINIALLDAPDPAVGDWVLVDRGFAVSRMDPVETRSFVDMVDALARSVEEDFVRDLALNGA